MVNFKFKRKLKLASFWRKSQRKLIKIWDRTTVITETALNLSNNSPVFVMSQGSVQDICNKSNNIPNR
jgi:hypothetical protein